MHSKVIVASLVLALAAGFSGSLSKNTTKAIATQQENKIVCNEHDHDQCHDCEENELFGAQEADETCVFAPRTIAKKELRTSSGAKYLYLSRGLSETINGSAKWYAFTAPYEGKFNFYTTGNMSTYGELRSSTASNASVYASGSTGGSGNNFRISYNFYRGQTLYLKVYEYNGNSGQATIYVSHTHSYTQPAYPFGTSHRMFCTCGAYSSVSFTPDDYYSGHGHNMIHCSTCDNWIEMPQYPHTHSFNNFYYYSSSQHVKVCACGYVEYASHTFDQIIRGSVYDEKHCSVCDAWVAVAHTHNYNQLQEYNSTQHKKVCSSCGSYVLENHNYSNYQFESMALHRVSCACGSYYTSNHVFSHYDENGGHGVNGYVRCDLCDYGVPTYGIRDGGSAGYYYDDGDLRFFVFEASESANYIFESTHTSGDPQAVVYDLNSNNSLTYFDEFDDEKGNGDFIFTRYLTAGQRILVGMHGYDYYYIGTYTLLVNKAHTHSYTTLVNLNGTQHQWVCSCGEALPPEDHVFDNYEYNNAHTHTKTCFCGRTITEEHVLSSYSEYGGHGVTGYVNCELCDGDTAVFGINEGGSLGYYYDDDDVRYFIFEALESTEYVFESTHEEGDPTLDVYRINSDNSIEFLSHYDDEKPNNDFMATISLQAGDRLLLEVYGYDYYYIGTYTIYAHKAHYHSYNQLVNYDYNQHEAVCECGASELRPHEFTNWQSYTKGQHRKTCPCGAVRYEEHNFTSYVPYGHGHNESLYCEDCGEYIELINYNETTSHGGCIDAFDCDWYVFRDLLNGALTFDILATGPIVVDIYICEYGEAPNQITDVLYSEYGSGVLQMNLNSDQMAYARVRNPDWEEADYSLDIYRA